VTRMGILEETSSIKDEVVKVMGSSTFLDGSGNYSCIGSGEVDWEGSMVSCGGDGDFFVIRFMYTLASRLGSSVMLIKV